MLDRVFGALAFRSAEAAWIEKDAFNGNARQTDIGIPAATGRTLEAECLNAAVIARRPLAFDDEPSVTPPAR